MSFSVFRSVRKPVTYDRQNLGFRSHLLYLASILYIPRFEQFKILEIFKIGLFLHFILKIFKTFIF